MPVLRVAATTDNLSKVTDFVDAPLAQCGTDSKIRMQIRLAVEEVFVNISSYAYDSGSGEAEIEYEMLHDPERIRITFTDSGEPFDPLEKEDPDLSEEGLLGRVGGLGIFLVKNTMDKIEYERKNNKNVLTAEKNIG